MRAFRNAYRWLFLATLFYAPWAYGCTTAETIVLLNYLLAAVAVLWIGESLVSRRIPQVPRIVAAIAGVLLVIGWGMALNARAIFDPDYFVFVPVQRLAPLLPGSYDQVNSIAMMTRWTLLVVVICFVADLVQRPVWLLRLWSAAALAGASVALLGLLQKASGAGMIFWQDPIPYTGLTFFAAFYYHANAGAYLNLVFPLTVGLAGRAALGRQSPAARAFWLSAAVLVTIAILANTSRAAQVLGLLIMAVLAGVNAPALWQSARRAEAPTLLVGALILAFAVYAVAQASRLDKPLKRWAEFNEPITENTRWLVTKTAWPVAQEAGWFGFGPATFRSVFPRYVETADTRLRGIWRFLHQDYVQTVIEWGWIGSAALGLLFFAGMGAALHAWRSARKKWLPRQRVVVPLVLLALGSVALHALVDFPLQIASIQLYVATYLGICWGARAWAEGPATRI